MNTTQSASAGYVDEDEASDRCIRPGWYIFQDGTMRGAYGSLSPFSSEEEAQAAISGQPA